MLIDGKKIAEVMLAEAAEEVKTLRQDQSKPPRLAAILVSGRHSEVEPLSKEAQPLTGGLRKFLELKKKAAEKAGIEFRLYEFPENITTQKLRKEIVKIAKAKVNDGILVELPLPAHINAQYILNAIPPEKDIDVLSEKAQGAFFAGRSFVLPPAVEAVKRIFKYLNIEISGKNCAVFGYGLLVGKPISHWLASQGATVSIINEFTSDPKRYSLSADIIISGVGKQNLIKADMIKEGSVVIDFGYENLDGRVTGDVNFEEASKRAALITPVPGGVGPIVIAAVFKNLVGLVRQYKKWTK